MSKKQKSAAQKAKKTAKKALKTVGNHGPLAAATLAVGGVAASVLASDKFRQAVGDFALSAIERATRALSQVSAKVKRPEMSERNSATDNGERATA